MRFSAFDTTFGVASALGRRALTLAAVCAAIGLMAPAAHAQPAAAASAPVADVDTKAQTEKCLRCHDDAEMKSEAGKPVAVMEEEYRRSAHRKLDCAGCHTAALTVKHPANALGPVDPQVCHECHGDEMQAVATSVHGRRASGANAIRDCTNCHDDLHTLPRSGDPASPMAPVNQIQTCGACHEDMMHNYETSAHARALLRAGLTTMAPSCSSCHGTHQILPKDDPKSKTHVSHIPETCGACHAGVLTEWQESAHGQALAAGNLQSPSCSGCHESHGVQRVDTAGLQRDVAVRCGNCHENVSGSFMDSFHGKATALGHTGSAACASCHTPHRNLPASDPQSSVHPDNLAATCGACHANVNASFLTFDPHANPADPSRNVFVHWIWFGMTGLLIGVFGFFGLHGLLWLQRAIVGKMRGEFAFGHVSDGPYVRRFSSMQMGVHISIVVSFLVLAATGLPLKFAEAPWAPELMNIIGGPVVAGWLHRLAGIVTFGYFVVHLGMLVHGWFVKGERGYFWGPRSMVPQLKDLRDFVGMMKYFLYLGPRPKFDRFTYWEKFDYLAVFWGVAIIGISGLVLWFPTFFTTFLPGWALNAAYVIHSDEALLATGFIFLFHFFHTHLRPEAFPLDPVVFVGAQPLERFKDERPLEYERLVAQGKLDDYLVPPPTPAQMTRAHIFGFTALLIGVALAAMIFVALFTVGVH